MKTNRSQGEPQIFARLGRAVVGHPWRVIAVWAVAAIAVITLSPGLPTSNDESDFLPGHYESVKAQKVQDRAFPDTFAPAAVVVVRREDGGPLSDADAARATGLARSAEAAHIKDVTAVVAAPPAPNRRVQTLSVRMRDGVATNGPEAVEAMRALRGRLGDLTAGTGLRARTTGEAAAALDDADAGGDADALVMIATLVLILVLLLAIFRSPVTALLPIAVLAVLSQVADGLIAATVRALGLRADGSASQLLIVVLFGVGTDYILFLMFRYRERLRAGDDPRNAMISALARVGEAITSAAGVVAIAFLAMTLSSLSLFRSWGPSLAIAVLVTLLGGLTLVPAVVSLLGTRVFWPSRAWRHEPDAARFARLGASVARRPAAYVAVTGAVLAVLAAGALGFKPDFDLAAGALPSSAESRVALEDLKRGLPAGATDPTHVYVTGRALDERTLAGFGDRLKAVEGVGQVAPPRVSPDGGTAGFSVVLTSAPESAEALGIVRGPLRRAAHEAAPDGTSVLVGGSTAVFADVRSAMSRDYSIVFPTAAALIVLVLGLLLRSLVAPWYLIAAVGLGFGATLGTASLLFQGIGDAPGLLFHLPLIMYMFVVALGTDYNILIMARLREEARQGVAPRPALAAAIRHTGPTIAAAGLILAGSFAALTLAGNRVLVQVGFAISFGIAITAFAMALFLTPGITALIGHRAWWPGHGGAPAARPVPEPAEQRTP
ncbi:MMPL family transporter [Actinomadura roseirufa]|uniref:MMPL family transporter n=1 Tax=Actinomadura roseirufa TaxID=2094049 RepID=UPI001A95591C|nr:MMPL family transporter [Actinomadura roseirufa]